MIRVYSPPSRWADADLETGAHTGITRVAGMPAARAARATPRAWFPALAAITPCTAWGSRERTLFAAPRILNEPDTWRFSSLERTFPPNVSDRGSSSTRGVGYASR